MKIFPPYIMHVRRFIGFPSWVDGFTFWPFIFVREGSSRTLLEHEKIHFKQQARGLLIFFYLKYIYYNWKYGYKNNPYEVYAYAHQDDWETELRK